MIWRLSALVLACVACQVVGSIRQPELVALESGSRWLADVQKDWRQVRGCVSCHTSGWGMVAQPLLSDAVEEEAGRDFAKEYLLAYLDKKVEPHGQHGSVEGLVATSAFLSLSDARTGNGVSEETWRGLDYAWGQLSEAGTWEEWLSCNWPPFESDLEFGPTLALVALGELREQFGVRSRDERAAEKMIHYLQAEDPDGLHRKVMRLWAGHYWPQLLTKVEASEWRREVLEAQAADGGWSMGDLAGEDWKRDGGEPQSAFSEAYATAFCAYVLGELSQESSRAVARARAWLVTNQLASGGWWTRSPRRDREHYISRAATSFALMVLARSSDEI